MTTVIERDTVIPTDDGRELAGRWFEPSSDPVGVVVVAPAMATPGRFYRSFATWLSEQGLRTLTFDLRGVDGSARGHVREESADMLRWAGDAAAALRHARDSTDGLPISWVGHSLGGQVLPFVDHEDLAGAVLVATGSGYWRLAPPRLRRTVPLLWYAVAPVTSRLLGYFPGRRLRMVGDLPAGVMLQWARWCRHPDYIASESAEVRERFAAVRTPIVALAFTDDSMMSRGSLDSLLRWYRRTTPRVVESSPEELGTGPIGHFGLFRSGSRPLWDTLVLPHLATTRAPALPFPTGPGH